MALDPTRKIIQIAYSVTPDEVPTGLELGELGINVSSPPKIWIGCAPAIDITELRELPLASYAPSVAWVAGTDPGGVSFFINNTGRELTIKEISGVVETANGSAAYIRVVKARDDDPLGAGTDLHNVHFDADETEGRVQHLIPNGETLENGWRLGLLALAADEWDKSIGSITVYLE